MKHACITFVLFVLFNFTVKAQTIFLPEFGIYKYQHGEIAESFKRQDINYVTLKSEWYIPSLNYKLNTPENEFQVKNWFQRDWFVMQDMFSFDQKAFIKFYGGSTFNEAKRRQYAKFPFNKKKFVHHKTSPAMKEWGGLTHPPIKKLTLPLEQYDSNFGVLDYTKIESPYFSPALQNEIDDVSMSELTFGNTIVALADHDAFLGKMELIKKAKETILMSSLVFVCDQSTRKLTNLLIQKQREGLMIKILVDGTIGRLLGHTECVKMLRDGGIEVALTKDFLKHKLKTIYHTKTLIVDFKEAIAGGHNMIDADNLSRMTDFMNRDVDLYIKGPMVTDIVKQFSENWNYQATLNVNLNPLYKIQVAVRNKLKEERALGLRGREYYPEILGNTQTRMQGVCRFIKQAPYEDRHTIGKAYLKLLSKVSKHLVIADPIKSDTLTLNMSDVPLSERMDSFDMFNLLHSRVQKLARLGKKVDYITTNINMAGNENVAIMNERIRNQLDSGLELSALWSLAKLAGSNRYYGKPHYKNLLQDWLPFSNVHVWKHMSFMHSKIFYFDRVLASVGSYNFQHNATDHSYESTVICLDEKLNRDLDKILVEDMANSIPLIFSRLQ